MQCFFHPTQMTNVRCHYCSRALCTSCDHRIKGFPYCQECIVAGIEALQRPVYGQDYRQPSSHTAGKSPVLASLFGLVPGLGAAYNGQPVKALCHFLLPMSIWQLAAVMHGLPSASAVLAGIALYLFSLYDAWQTAQRARAGADLATEDQRIKLWLQTNIHLWGSMLIAIGALTLLKQFAPQLTRQAWPLLLIVAGFFLLRDYFSRSAQAVAQQPAAAPYPPRPMSFMATGLTSGLSTNSPTHYDHSTPGESSNVIKADNRFDRWG